jgi:alkaline phosphatase
MIGDGMGLTQISSGMYANDNSTALEQFDYIGLSKTASFDKLITDSAASGTAMATGIKTNNKVLGISPDNIHQKSILEICKEKGYKTALIATSSIVHATPASFYAKENSRYNYENIALQLRNHKIDIFIGGGSKYFTTRKDKRNLINEMSEYEFIKSLDELEKSISTKVGYFTYFDEPPSILNGRPANLDLITRTVLNKLSLNKSPFIVVIEGSQIDWGGHDNDSKMVLSEFIDFDSAVKEALEFAKNDGNTLVVVTADHETGGMSLNGGEINNVNIKFNTKSHTGTMVPVFSFGPSSENFNGIYENTQIFYKLKESIK